jgi:CubicO group peptidase (beta-lactamase class C family)
VGIANGDDESILPFGITNIEHPLPVTEGTLFHIGSTTKTITGTIIMQLVEQGKIDLDAPVRTYLPEFKIGDEDAASQATVRHLLTHTGGWEGDVFDDPSRGDDALARMIPLLADRPQITPLGQIWSYNNASFYVAGRIIELITGKRYETAAKEMLLDPLGMNRSYFFEEEIMPHRFAVGHEVHEGTLRLSRMFQLPRSVSAVGRLTSTAHDQLTYARFHMAGGVTTDGTRLLSPESVRLMQTPVAAADNGSYIGLTWFIKDVGGVRTISHGGSTSGQMSEFLFVPEKNFAITVLTNGGYGHSLGAEVVSWALAEYCGASDPKPEPLTLSPEEIAPYAGKYHSPGGYLDLRQEGTDLFLQPVQTRSSLGLPIQDPPPPVRAGIIEGDRLLILDDPMKGTQGEFLRGPDGEILWLRLGKRINKREK